MKIIPFSSLCLLANFALAQGNCPEFASPAAPKPVKVTFYTSTAECFTLSGPSGAINPEPAKKVTFTMDFGTMKTKTKLSNGTELEKNVMVTNEALASMVYEITFNEKKGEWDIKNRLGQADVTAAEHQKNEAQFDKMVEDRKAADAARDKEWADASAERKAKAEAERAAEEKAAADKKAEADKARADAAAADKAKADAAAANKESQATNPNSTPAANNSGTSSNVSASVKVDAPAGYPYGICFRYQGKPIVNVKFTVKNTKGNKEVIMSGTTDAEGIAVMYTTHEMGSYDTEIYFEVDGKKGGSTFPTLNLGNTSQQAIIMDYNQQVEGRMQYSKQSRTECEKAYGLNLIFK